MVDIGLFGSQTRYYRIRPESDPSHSLKPITIGKQLSESEFESESGNGGQKGTGTSTSNLYPPNARDSSAAGDPASDPYIIQPGSVDLVARAYPSINKLFQRAISALPNSQTSNGLLLPIYAAVRKEIWYHTDMYFYRDILFMLGRNKKIKVKQVWADLRSEEVLLDQHTYGDILRAFSDGGLLDLATEFYDEMRSSPDLSFSLPFRVILKGLILYPDLREKVKDDFLELFPDMLVYDLPEDLLDEQK